MSIEILKDPEHPEESLGPQPDAEIIEEKTTLRKLDSTDVPTPLTKMNSKDSGEGIPEGTRIDRNGTPIIKSTSRTLEEKKSRKHKVTFIDKLDNTKDLHTYHFVLSYKKYNSMNTFDPYEYNEAEG